MDVELNNLHNPYRDAFLRAKNSLANLPGAVRQAWA